MAESEDRSSENLCVHNVTKRAIDWIDLAIRGSPINYLLKLRAKTLISVD